MLPAQSYPIRARGEEGSTGSRCESPNMSDWALCRVGQGGLRRSNRRCIRVTRISVGPTLQASEAPFDETAVRDASDSLGAYTWHGKSRAMTPNDLLCVE